MIYRSSSTSITINTRETSIKSNFYSPEQGTIAPEEPDLKELRVNEAPEEHKAPI